MIKRLIKVVQLSCLGHSGLCHEEGRLNEGVISLLQPVHSVVDEGLVESHAGPGKIVSSVTCDFSTALKVDGAEPEQHFVVRKNVGALFERAVLFRGELLY